ncbi:KamA family radical SAM protein [Persephonella sp. KM09-Lau-8]|uniref:KamA family radical SAM protein n=1 Tax=Persephonella sp. KM09-Lau-8 TaxID=1158345 RepID=UPI00049807C0|nr:KamA family radical SAM protein [Persephonella sp. KM09-Lau-8]
MRVLPENHWKKLWNVEEKDWKNWHWQVKNRIKSLSELEKITGKDFSKEKITEKVFKVGTTPYYLSLAKDFSKNDPIFRQIIPDLAEIDETIQSYGSFDPFNEETLSPVEGLTHRYPDRVLFRATNFCSVYCRHCMRKRIFLEGEKARTYQEYDRMFEYIKKNKNIKEVLISGGDPLTLPNKKIGYILENLYRIEHIDIIRIGSRELVVNPFRFYDEKLLKLFEKYEKIWLVTHFNHPDEITQETKQAVKNILSTGTPVLNQTVLLKGINDNEKIMEKLMRSLLKVKIKPYYLFFCDPTKGVLHFKTSLKKGIRIMEYLRGRVSGLGIPTYAIDLPAGMGKVPLLPDYIVGEDENYIIFKNYEGKTVKVSKSYLI